MDALRHFHPLVPPRHASQRLPLRFNQPSPAQFAGLHGVAGLRVASTSAGASRPTVQRSDQAPDAIMGGRP